MYTTYVWPIKNWFHSTLCFVQLYCPSWNKKKTRPSFTISENFVFMKHWRPWCWQFRRIKQWNFELLFRLLEKQTQCRKLESFNKLLLIDYLQLRIAILQLRGRSGGQTWNRGAQSSNGGQGTTASSLATAMRHCVIQLKDHQIVETAEKIYMTPITWPVIAIWISFSFLCVDIDLFVIFLCTSDFYSLTYTQ